MEWLYLAAFCSELVLRLAQVNVADVDLWGRLSVPMIYDACGRLPVSDYFSFTAYGHPWFDHEWLTGFLFHGALAGLGDAGLTLFKWFLALGMVSLLWLLNRWLKTAPLLVFCVAMLAIPMLWIGFGATARSQNLTYFLFALLLVILQRLRVRPSWLTVSLVVPLALVWVNVHAGFVVGLGVVILYAAGSWLNREPTGPFVVAAGLFGVTSLVNPYGISYWRFVAYAISLKRPEIAEWGFTNPLIPRYWAFVVLSLVVVAAIIGAWKAKRWAVDWIPVLVVLATAFFAWRAAKHQPLFAVAAVAFLPMLVRQAWPAFFVGRRLVLELRRPWIESATALWLPVGVTVVSLAVLGIVVTGQERALGVQIPYGNFNPLGNGNMPYPVNAVKFLESAPFGGNLLAPFDHGEFLLYRLYPKFRVAMDGRLEEVYPESTYREMMRFFSSVPPDWEIADRWNADVVLWPQHGAVMTRADVSDEFAVVHQDGEYIVLARWSVLARARPASVEPLELFNGPVFLEDFLRPAADLRRFASYCDEPHHGLDPMVPGGAPP